MIPKGLFTQIAMMIVAVGILVTYVQPAFSQIGDVQEDILVYQNERQKVVTVNSRLASLVSQLESVSRDEQLRLMRYLPDEVDGIAITRDLALISSAAGVLYENASYKGEVKVDRAKEKDLADSMPTAHALDFSVQGTYPQIKKLFRLLEQNDYPLEVHSVSVKQNDGGFLSVSMKIITYSFRPAETNEIEF